MKYILKFWLNYGKGWLKTKLTQSNHQDRPRLYRDIGILNPTIGTYNLGDLIIYQSVYEILRSIYNEAIFSDFPTQLHTCYDAMALMQEKDLLFVAGTNLLSSNLEEKHQWKVHRGVKKYLNNRVILMGCGWWQYQGAPNRYTVDIYRNLLSDNFLHSVRDQYTADKLFDIGFKNVVNTSCPTLWTLTSDKCAKIPQSKAQNVITTLTFYKKNPKIDRHMLDILSNNYKKVYLWIQGLNDAYYYKEILHQSDNNIEVLPPTLEAFDSMASEQSIDYIGTRLHAGIRALQHNVRSMIISVDNRAHELGKDVNLNVVDRNNLEQILTFIENDYVTDIRLPQNNITNWLSSLKK